MKVCSKKPICLHARCRGLCECPATCNDGVDPTAAKPRERIPPEIWGPPLWEKIHHRAIESETHFDADAERRWLKAIALAMPCGECRLHWLKWSTTNPADLSSASAYFTWTVAAHNAVNRLLGKAEMTLEQALEQWPVRV